jgi:hypothetical protein
MQHKLARRRCSALHRARMLPEHFGIVGVSRQSDAASRCCSSCTRCLAAPATRR